MTQPNPAIDPNTNRLMMVAPLVFGFILYRQPNASMLYWLTSHLPGIAQRRWLGKRYA
jgi:membrane protein insertase Oxa1/YidC/SpoIIIJ